MIFIVIVDLLFYWKVLSSLKPYCWSKMEWSTFFILILASSQYPRSTFFWATGVGTKGFFALGNHFVKLVSSFLISYLNMCHVFKIFSVLFICPAKHGVLILACWWQIKRTYWSANCINPVMKEYYTPVQLGLLGRLCK